MQLNDEFEVPLPVAEAWAVLTDIERITPYLPGIWLREVGTDEYQGVVKVKIGPVTVWYEGVARYLLLDTDAHKAVLKAEGGEIHGHGTGSALVTATLSPSPGGTKVQVTTVLAVDGKLAPFAGEPLTALSRSLIAEFAENLEYSVQAVPRTASRRRVTRADSVPAHLGNPQRAWEAATRGLNQFLPVAGIVIAVLFVGYWLGLSGGRHVRWTSPLAEPAWAPGSCGHE